MKDKLELARGVIEEAYKLDVSTLARKAAEIIRKKSLTGNSATSAVFDVVAESQRCLNVGQALEALIFSQYDRAVFEQHSPGCGCLDWSDPTVWSHFAAHAVAADVVNELKTKFDITVSRITTDFKPHGSPEGLVS